MALGPGVRLGSHEVTALIGQGGMGEVYRATALTSPYPLSGLPVLSCRTVRNHLDSIFRNVDVHVRLEWMREDTALTAQVA